MRVEQDVLEVLDRAEKVGDRLTLVGQLDRKLYERANKALEAAGGKWNRSAKAHVFPIPAMDAVEPILLTGEIVSEKRAFDAFYTPADLAELIVALAGVSPGVTVLEPSAGGGAIAAAAKATGGNVMCVEIREREATALAEDGFTVDRADFLAMDPLQCGLFDVVVMNPPFSKQQDIRHVMHAAKFLRPGGTLVAIMSASVMFRDNALTRDFRDFVSDLDGEIERLPDAAFKASGTMVNTCLVTFRSPPAAAASIAA